MNKFFKLLKKELKEIITPKTIATMLLITLISFFLGFFIQKTNEIDIESSMAISIVDLDNSELSKSIISAIDKADIEVHNISDVKETERMHESRKYGLYSYIVIPENFEKDITVNHKQTTINIYDEPQSLSLISYTSATPSVVCNLINETIKNSLLTELLPSDYNPEFIDNPITTSKNTVYKSESTNCDSLLISTQLAKKTMFIPIIIFCLLTYASQATLSVLGSEKSDKTLETLLTTPVKRSQILFSKVVAACVLSIISSCGYIFSVILSMNNSLLGSNEMIEQASKLGIGLTTNDYMLIFANLILSLFITLMISIIIGILAEDSKKANSGISLIVFIMMIPYMTVSLFNIDKLPTMLVYLIKAIPFTHSFSAANNILFGNINDVYFGIIYQAIFFIILLAISIKLFSSDTVVIGNNKKHTKKLKGDFKI